MCIPVVRPSQKAIQAPRSGKRISTALVLYASMQGVIAARLTCFQAPQTASKRSAGGMPIKARCRGSVGDRQSTLARLPELVRLDAASSAGLTDEGVANDNASDESATGRHVPLCRVLA